MLPVDQIRLESWISVEELGLKWHGGAESVGHLFLLKYGLVILAADIVKWRERRLTAQKSLLRLSLVSTMTFKITG